VKLHPIRKGSLYFKIPLFAPQVAIFNKKRNQASQSSNRARGVRTHAKPAPENTPSFLEAAGAKYGGNYSNPAKLIAALL
jgi:hypothetical protein